MKLLSFAAIALLCSVTVLPHSLRAEEEEDAEQVILYTLGSTSAQSVMVTYFAINSLSDAYVKKVYGKEQAAQVLGIYLGATTAAKDAVEKCIEKGELDDSDKDTLRLIANSYTVLLEQCTALNEYIDTGDDAAAKKFESSRKKAQGILDKLLK